MDINHLEKFKNTIASGKTALGAVISLSDMAVCECAGDCGLDFVWIDAEHSPHTLDIIKVLQRIVIGQRGAEFLALVDKGDAPEGVEHGSDAGSAFIAQFPVIAHPGQEGGAVVIVGKQRINGRTWC